MNDERRRAAVRLGRRAACRSVLKGAIPTAEDNLVHRTRSSRRHAVALPLIALLIYGCLGCSRLRPLDELRVELGTTGELLRIGEQQLYLERRGEGEPVVLVHGLGGSSYTWRKVMPALAREYDVLAPDLNGFGLTDRPEDPEAYSREGQVRLLLRMLDTLGIDSAHFVAHSYGASLAMTLAARHPERVRSMVLVDAAGPDYPLERRRWLANIKPLVWFYARGGGLRDARIARKLRRAYHDDALVTEEVVGAYVSRMRVEGSVDAYRKMTRPRRSVPRETIRYADLNVPILVVWGQEDQLIRISTGEYYSSMLPDYRFVSIDGAGHFPMEEKPAEFLKHVRRFLGDHAERAAAAPVVPESVRTSR